MKPLIDDENMIPGRPDEGTTDVQQHHRQNNFALTVLKPKMSRPQTAALRMNGAETALIKANLQRAIRIS